MRDATAFLRAAGFAAARLDPLPADASFRTYARLSGGPVPALLMDAPPPEDVRPFLAVQRHIAGIGLSAPAILAADEAQGFLLLEDFGTATHSSLLDAGEDPLPLYLEAVETLAALHAAAPPPDLPAWGAERMAETTAATFLDWWWPAAFGAPADADVRAHLDAAIRAMLAPFAAAGCFVHRDYFPANLMRLPARPGPRRTGLIDFQDAARGSPAYDLVSLVEDGRRDVAPEIRAAAIARYLDARSGLNRDEFAAAMAACAAQRHLRVAALWVRLDRRDAKPRYLVHGPRCWRLLAAALDHPATRPLRDFLDARIPPALRRNPVAVTEPA
jgi:hypothetical protein